MDFKKLREFTQKEKARRARGEYHTIIAGSRTFEKLGPEIDDLVDTGVEQSGFKVVRVLSGTARGVDRAGERWAERNQVEVKKYPANWETEGRSAGYNRNVTMACHADALIAIWDGKSRGTKHMIDIMNEQEKPVFVLELRIV